MNSLGLLNYKKSDSRQYSEPLLERINHKDTWVTKMF